MSHQSYRSPRLTSIIGGILLAVLLLISVCLLGSVIKSVGTAILVIPARLGLLTQVRAADVAMLDMQQSPSRLAFSRPGLYHVYTADLSLLEAAALLGASNAEPWLVIRSARTGDEVPVGFVARGVRPYDTPLAPGRPILSFVIPTPGEYALTHPARQATLAVVPDYTTGKETALALIALAEGVLILGGAALLLRRRARRRRSPRREPE